MTDTRERTKSPPRPVLTFDGASHVDVEAQFQDDTAFTVTLWARPSALASGAARGLVGQPGERSITPGLRLGPSSRGLGYESLGADGQRVSGEIEGFFERDRWTHVAWVKRGGKFEIYRDGTLVAERIAPLYIHRGGGGYAIGWAGGFWHGEIAEVRIWKVALEPAEVKAEMHHPPRGDDPRLSHYWPLNEGDGDTAHDRTGQRHGKIRGARWTSQTVPFAPLRGESGIDSRSGVPSRHMRPQQKSYHKITTPEQLRVELQHAITLELSTIPPYLYAAYSIKDPSSRAAALIFGVAFEEMLHMMIAVNLLNAIGGSPRLTGPFAPAYPTFIPFHAAGGPFIQLQRASRDLMVNTFMQIEQPAAGRPLAAMEDGEELETIGQFYESILAGLIHCDEHHRLFIGDVARQQKATYFGGSGGRLHVVTDLRSAWRAIEQIVSQGEGTTGAYQGYGADATEGPPPVASFGQDRRSRELAHYFKFAALATGEVEIPETWPMETNFRTSHFGTRKEEQWARDLSDLFNACYVYMLRSMEHAFNSPASDGAFFSSSFPLMRSVLTPLGRLLAQTPLRRNNVIDDWKFDRTASLKLAPILATAGPSFEYVEWGLDRILETCEALCDPQIAPGDDRTRKGYRDVYMETLPGVLAALSRVERLPDDPA